MRYAQSQWLEPVIVNRTRGRGRARPFIRSSLLSRSNPHGSRQNVSAGNETGLLQRSPGREVRGTTAGGRNVPAFIADPLQLLHEERTKALSAKGLGHVHIDVAKRAIVVKENA